MSNRPWKIRYLRRGKERRRAGGKNEEGTNDGTNKDMGQGTGQGMGEGTGECTKEGTGEGTTTPRLSHMLRLVKLFYRKGDFFMIMFIDERLMCDDRNSRFW